MGGLVLREFRGIIFDLFHTLTPLEASSTGLRATSEILGVSRRDWNEQLLHYSDHRLRGKVTDPYQIIKGLAYRIDPTIPEDTLREAARTRADRFRRVLTAIDETILETLGILRARGKLLGLVSNADVMEISGWTGSPLRQHFVAAVFSCRSGYVKPERRAYEACLEKLGVVPEESLFVGDGGSDELRGAKAIGMTTVLVTHIVRQLWPEVIEARREHADYEIERIEELVR